MNAAGTIVGTYYYDAFGNILETSGSKNNPIRYAGYQYDEETGLYYLNARMYDPKIARFLQEDTYRGKANDPLSLNLYTYCHNEPVMYVDPTGHAEVSLRELAEKNGAIYIGWFPETKSAIVIINGITQVFKTSDYRMDKNRIMIEESTFYSLFKLKNPNDVKDSQKTNVGDNKSTGINTTPSPAPSEGTGKNESTPSNPFGDKWFISADEASALGLTTPSSNKPMIKELEGFGIQIELSGSIPGFTGAIGVEIIWYTNDSFERDKAGLYSSESELIPYIYVFVEGDTGASMTKSGVDYLIAV